MRYVLVVLLFGVAACDDAKDRQIAELQSEIASLRSQIAASAAPQTNRPPSATLPPATSPPPPSDDVAHRFVEFVRADPVRISRASGLKLNDVIDENGLVVDAEKIAIAVRAKTVRTYGKETAQRALVEYFGAELGNAVFYGKIKNPE